MANRVKVTGKLAESVRTDSQPGIVVPLVKNMLLARHGPDLDRRTDVIHPSEMAKPDWCARATWLRIQGKLVPAPEKFDFGRLNIFGEGNTIHAKWQKWLAETGNLWGNWECELCHWEYDGTSGNRPTRDQVQPDEGWEPGTDWYCPLGYGEPLAHMWSYREVPLAHGLVAGHADGALYDPGPPCLIEAKSIGLGTLRIEAPEFLSRYQHKDGTDLNGLWRGLAKPLKSHVRQGDIYLWLAGKNGLGIENMVYLYEFKANQQVKEFTVKFDQSRAQPLIDLAEGIEYALETKQEVPCNISRYGCDQCRATPVRRRNVRR